MKSAYESVYNYTAELLGSWFSQTFTPKNILAVATGGISTAIEDTKDKAKVSDILMDVASAGLNKPATTTIQQSDPAVRAALAVVTGGISEAIANTGKNIGEKALAIVTGGLSQPVEAVHDRNVKEARREDAEDTKSGVDQAYDEIRAGLESYGLDPADNYFDVSVQSGIQGYIGALQNFGLPTDKPFTITNHKNLEIKIAALKLDAEKKAISQGNLQLAAAVRARQAALDKISGAKNTKGTAQALSLTGALIAVPFFL
jgi:hypothetical protein